MACARTKLSHEPGNHQEYSGLLIWSLFCGSSKTDDCSLLINVKITILYDLVVDPVNPQCVPPKPSRVGGKRIPAPSIISETLPLPCYRGKIGSTEYPKPKKVILWGQTDPGITGRDKFEIRSCSAAKSRVALVPSVLLLP